MFLFDSPLNHVLFADATASATKNPSAFETLVVPIAIMIFLFYFMLIRPQAKKQKEQDQLMNSIKKGDDIITNTGMFGKITGLNENVATLEVADGVRIKILRNSISRKADSIKKQQS